MFDRVFSIQTGQGGLDPEDRRRKGHNYYSFTFIYLFIYYFLAFVIIFVESFLLPILLAEQFCFVK